MLSFLYLFYTAVFLKYALFYIWEKENDESSVMVETLLMLK